MKNNDYVVVLKSTNGWSNVLFEGNKVGYVSEAFLSSNSYKYQSIVLPVPSFKQFDERWAYQTIGSSGQTFKSIGCLTTAMAMSESYIKGYTITPPTYSKSVSYTSNGSLYWPSTYAVSTTSNYLSTIYNKLKEGKPVVIGAKKSSGSQHWVLVYGCKGSNSLSASNFLIHDPGSSYRDTLDDFFSAYPTYYKIAYYK
ncbi:MAG: C39 family peptidase [Acholeplasmatales bacterium]|nr:C39 family peptidase [Acholeplasmatales bacterium]